MDLQSLRETYYIYMRAKVHFLYVNAKSFRTKVCKKLDSYSPFRIIIRTFAAKTIISAR